ncbi:hypothetical protein H4582DRAFT_1878298 [Lactarius indigo]|nr:hypothetical protein H4582DRAFT_1878298 [Lactarius indigo]
MASILNLFRDIIYKLRSTRGFVRLFIRRCAWFLAFFGRRLGILRLWDDRKRQGTFSKADQAKRSSPSTETNLESTGYVIVAASSVPASASQASLRDVSDATQQSQRAASGTTPPSDRDHAKPSFASSFDARSRLRRRSTDSGSSVRSRSSDRLSIIQTHSRESSHVPVGQTTRFPRAPHSQFGRRPSASSSRESSRSPSPTDRGPQPHLEIDLHPPTQVDSGNSPINPPSVTSYADAQLSSPSILGSRSRRSSTTSVVVEVVNPSIDSLPHRSFTDGLPLSEEPHTTVHFPFVDTLDLPNGRFLQLINSEQVPRYTKDVTVPRKRTNFKIPPLTTTFLHIPEKMGLEQGSLEGDCTPWVPATHPDGALYFFDQDRRLFTDTDMHDPVLREEMEDFYHHLQRILHHVGQVIPSKNYDLVLDILPTKDGRISWSYYYACHETRCLFWLDLCDATQMTSELLGVRSLAHIKHRLESLYWNHWSLFPTVLEGRCLDPAVVDELVGVLSHGCMDVMTSQLSTVPYDADTMQKMLELVRNAKESDAGLVYHTAGVTRLLGYFAHWRFLYFHGQASARLERHKTVYTHPDRERTLLITSLSPVLFLAPEGYLRELEKVWIDDVVFERVWRKFISGLLKEWEQLILSSTVVLSVNVGFLAIPGVIVSNISSDITSTSQLVIFTSPAQIASCMSIVASAGSVVVGLLLVRRNSAKQNEDPEGASTYLFQITHRVFGLEPMAIVFSLPWALLMWSMVTFFVALSLFCFGTSNAPTRKFVAVTFVAVAVLVGWCIRCTWGSSGAMEAWYGGLLPSTTHALNNARAAGHRILSSIDPGSFQGSRSPTAPDRAGSEIARPYREGEDSIV